MASRRQGSAWKTQRRGKHVNVIYGTSDCDKRSSSVGTGYRWSEPGEWSCKPALVGEGVELQESCGEARSGQNASGESWECVAEEGVSKKRQTVLIEESVEANGCYGEQSGEISAEGECADYMQNEERCAGGEYGQSKETCCDREGEEVVVIGQTATEETLTEAGDIGGAGGFAGRSRGQRKHVQSAVKEKEVVGRKDSDGTMPEGEMTHSTYNKIQLPGHEDSGILIIDYAFPNGIQREGHPRPWRPYYGTLERAFLPDSPEGRQVLELLRQAFDRKLTFQVATGPDGDGVVEFSDIPHKTSIRGGKKGCGYPDPDYLNEVKRVLRDKYGIE